MKLTSGMRLRSAVCTTEVIVVRPGGDAEHSHAFEPLLLNLANVVDQVRVRAAVARHLDEAHGVR